MTDSHDHPFYEVVETATAQIERGATVFQKYTCEHCQARVTMEVPNTFYKTGRCEGCGGITDIERDGCNFLAILSVGRR